jgi:hypothetical protein
MPKHTVAGGRIVHTLKQGECANAHHAEAQ